MKLGTHHLILANEFCLTKGCVGYLVTISLESWWLEKNFFPLKSYLHANLFPNKKFEFELFENPTF